MAKNADVSSYQDDFRRLNEIRAQAHHDHRRAQQARRRAPRPDPQPHQRGFLPGRHRPRDGRDPPGRPEDARRASRPPAACCCGRYRRPGELLAAASRARLAGRLPWAPIMPPGPHCSRSPCPALGAPSCRLPPPLSTPALWLTGAERWLLLAGLSIALGGLAGRGLARQYLARDDTPAAPVRPPGPWRCAGRSPPARPARPC